jgi:prolipoprotein diacylglyceryltransferase
VPWAIDFGDGIARHPTQLYEIAFLALLTAWLARRIRRPHAGGDVFKGFMIGYLGFRFGLEFLKPGVLLSGLDVIQWACAATLLYYIHYYVRQYLRQNTAFAARGGWGGLRALSGSGETAHG